MEEMKERYLELALEDKGDFRGGIEQAGRKGESLKLCCWPVG